MSLHRSSLWTGSVRRRQLTLLFGDVALLFLVAVVAVVLKRVFVDGIPWSDVLMEALPGGVWALISGYVFSLYIFDQYNLQREISGRGAAAVLALATLVGVALATTITFFLRSLELGRYVVVFYIPLAFTALYLWRRFFHARLMRFDRPHRVLLVATNPVERGIESELRGRPLGDYTVAGEFYVTGTASDDGRQIVDAQNRRLDEAVRDEEVDTLVFSARGGFPPEYLEQAIDWKFDGVGVYDSANFYGAMTGRVPIETIDGRWILDHLSQPYGSPVVWRLKRVSDLLLASLGLLLTLPFWPLLMLAIMIDSPGRPIFRQERLGLRQKPIVIAKFRTMYDLGEPEGEAAYAQKEDPRVTRVGKWLRKTRLDELPQLWNVLTGELSIVGLRPIRKINADRLASFIPFYHLRFSMKPGLTGWPQIRYRYADDDESHMRKFEYELYHIQNASLAFDLYLMVKTFQMIVFGRGQ